MRVHISLLSEVQDSNASKGITQTTLRCTVAGQLKQSATHCI